uniref:Putative CopG n=1 Tax=Saccharolobus islandicus TaxID=43080 RepID=A8TKM7_SACIS|nr:hypothetical protein [Sulfolobus islandicus]ABV26260.1 putative CopG [Sulfolobus islandicus]
MSKKEKITFLRLSEEEKQLLLGIAKYYGIAEADVIRIAIKEFAKNHGMDASS